MLKLYALEGDLSRVQPGFFDVVGTARHEAWAQLNGITADEAMRRYMALVHQLLA